MAQKHTIDETQSPITYPAQEHPKRMRPNTNEEQNIDDREASSSSPSIHSALRSSPSVTGKERTSSMSSFNQSEMGEEEEEESDSSVSSSSEDDSSEASDGDEVATVTARQKPDISAAGIGRGAGDLQERLRAFLPKFAEANEKLERDAGEGAGLEDVGDDEPHIEMNLGLGVLEEKGDGEGSEEESEGEDYGEGGSGSVGEEGKRQEKDVMGKLMGGREKHEGGIEEVG